MHFGNLRTAVAAYLCAKTSNRGFLVRIEDVDSKRSRLEFSEAARNDLKLLGLGSETEVVYQSRRGSLYQSMLERLVQKNLVYECYCSRADIGAAASAPHGKPGIYPGTCRNLGAEQRQEKRVELVSQGRQPALRLRAPLDTEYTVTDRLRGKVTGMLHDVVLRRTDGDWAYQLAVVVDDMVQGVTQVVRGADLVSASPVQAWLTEILGGSAPEYAHVPLVMNACGQRLAKRDKSVTLREMRELGWSEAKILYEILRTLGWVPQSKIAAELDVITAPQILEQAVQNWSVDSIPPVPCIFAPGD